MRGIKMNGISNTSLSGPPPHSAPASPTPQKTFRIQDMTNNIYTVTIDSRCTINELKIKLNKVSGFPIEQIQLFTAESKTYLKDYKEPPQNTSDLKVILDPQKTDMKYLGDLFRTAESSDESLFNMGANTNPPQPVEFPTMKLTRKRY
jgi:hypothetical protein